ncbi:uncharacterized protein LOC144866859 [Branchiostoma floridae x Branchiostoma japonicum]
MGLTLQLSTADKVTTDTEFCLGKPNRDFADPLNCHYYYKCSNGEAYHVPCQRPMIINLVYDEEKGQCVYQRAAPPPCGVSMHCNKAMTENQHHPAVTTRNAPFSQS